MQGGHLASQKESGGTGRWYPPDADGGDAGPVMGRPARTSSENNPGPGTCGSAEGGAAGRLARQKEMTSHVSRMTSAPGARGSGGGMAVDDAAADVSLGGGTPALRLRGARSTPCGGSNAGRAGQIAEEDSPGSRASPVPMAGLGAHGPGDPKKREQQQPLAQGLSQKGPGAAKGQKLDYMNNPHLCLTAAEQLDKARSDAAVGLVKVIPWRETTLGKPDEPGPGGFERTAEERFEAVVRAVYAKGPSRNKSAASLILKMAALKSEREGKPVSPTDVFPMQPGFMEAAKAHFEQTKGCATRANNMHEDIRHLRMLGLEVPSQADVESALARPAVKRPAGARPAPAKGARQALYPKHVCDIEFFSVHGRGRDDPLIRAAKEAGKEYPDPPLTEDGDLMPIQVYALVEWAQLAAGDRGMGIWASTWNKPLDENTAMYTACIDKDGRMKVPRVVPDGGFERDKHPLIVGYSKKMVGQPLTPFFRYNKGESMRPEKSDRWVGPKEWPKQPRLPVTPVAAKSTAMGSLRAARSHIIGVPESTLATLKISGTHTDRHVAPEISGLLSWPDPEKRVLGDWADPGSDEDGPKRKKKRVSFAIASHAETYHPKATEEHTLASRKRLTDAARAFIARAGGYEALQPDTKWSDIIPKQSPGEEFDRFYGPSWSKSGTDVVGEAIDTIGEFLVEARRSTRARSPAPSKEL